MAKKTTLLIIILAAVTAVLLYLAITNENQISAPKTAEKTLPVKKPAAKTAKLFFNPQNLDLSSGAASPTSTVDIIVDSGGTDISGVQAELSFDPKAITNVRLTPSLADGFFGASANILINEVDSETGRVSFAVAIPPNTAGKAGIGKIATLSFQKAFNAPPTTTVTFLDKTLVTKLGENESVLKETLPLNLVLSQATTSPYNPPVTTQ